MDFVSIPPIKGPPHHTLTLSLTVPSSVSLLLHVPSFKYPADADTFFFISAVGHISRLQDGFVKAVTDVVNVNDVVKARVVDVMVKQNKITLSLQSETLVDRERESIARFKGEADTHTPDSKGSSSKKPKRTKAQQEARNERRKEKKASSHEGATAAD